MEVVPRLITLHDSAAAAPVDRSRRGPRSSHLEFAATLSKKAASARGAIDAH
jgi:hypothetical protein